MPKTVFRGVYCPLATPFDHRGELYPTKIRHNVTRLNRTGLAGYLVGDEAGEGAALSSAEKAALFQETAAVAESTKTLIAAVTSGSNVESLRLAQAAQEHGFAFAAARHAHVAGGEAAESLYFRTLADQSPLPLIVLRGAESEMTASTLLAIAEHPNVAAVAADGSLLPALLEGQAPVISTREQAICADWEAGVRAFLSPLANAIPFYLLCLEEALRTREGAAAEDLQARAQGALDRISSQLGSAGLKCAMDLRGAYGGAVRLPRLRLGADEAAEVERLLAGLAS